MKSIRTKITVCLILTVLISLVASGSSSIMLNYNSAMSTVEQMMSETAVLATGVDGLQKCSHGSWMYSAAIRSGCSAG